MRRSFANQAPNKESHLIHSTQELSGSALSLKEKQALDAIRRIRNAFAHAIRPIDFENEHVAKACATLPHYDLTQKELKKLSPHRAKYIKCVVTIANYLAKTFGTDPRKAEISKLVTDPYAHES